MLETIRHLREIGVEVRFEKEGINTFDGKGEVLLTLLSSFAQEEVQSLSENVKWGTRKRFEKGIPNGHFRMLGYHWEGDQLVITPEEAAIVRRIFYSYLNDGKSRVELAKELNNEGIRSINGCRFQDSSIKTILTNVTYTGNLLLQKEYIADPITKKRRKNKGELTQYFVENTHEAIIPAEVFEAVQAEMKRRRDLGPKGNKSLNLSCFSSVIKCSCCGCSYQRSSRKNRNGTEGRYVVWICATSRKGHKCDAKNLPEIALKKTCCEVLGMEVFSADVFTEQIAKLLTEDGIPTPGHKTKWSARTVSSILSNEKYKGDALLQKSYTVDFLTKKQRRNNGEIQQYYVEGNHEAIIAPEIFDMVQRELALRKPGANRHSGVRVFSGTVYCAECGGLYGSKLWHSNDQYRRVMWRCNHKYDNDQHCHTPSLTEDELQAAFLSSFNKLLTERDEIQANYELIKEQLYGLKELESELASISAEEEVAAELINQCIRENACVALNQDDYNTRYQALCDQHDAIQARLDSLEAEIKRRKLRRSDIDRFIGDLMRQPAIITTFDPILWSTMVERVTVHGKNDLRFTFRNGTEITA